jgi:altronate hydrolase
MKKKVIKVHPADTVWVALSDIHPGEKVWMGAEKLIAEEFIPAKHKIFTKDLSKGDKVKMYGSTVGTLKSDVRVGQLMTTSNTEHAADAYAYQGSSYQWQAPDPGSFREQTFKGYLREDGRVGTANYWLFIPTVFCENRNLDVIREALHRELGYQSPDQYAAYVKRLVFAYEQGEESVEELWHETSQQLERRQVFPNIDGIKFLNHTGGCGGTRQDAETLGRLLAGYADHPNVAGVTLLSLGCQHLQIADFQSYLLERNPSFNKPLLIFEQQQYASEQKLVSDAIRSTFQELVKANQQHRVEVPLSRLCIGVKCGGSDGFSGISANPAVGYCADLLVAVGGQVLLAEFPELCGAEQEIIDRSVDEATAVKFIQLMESYNRMALQVGSGFHMNPSPGNIKDGLITDAIKSIGACRKGGTSPVVDVLDYTEPVKKAGLSLVCTPGNDVEATTGKTASGANLILFTTGLGTPTGNPICPVIKIATNSPLAKRMRDIIDFDTGSIVEGEQSIEEVGAALLAFVVEVASGSIVPKAVQLGQDDFIPWKRGVSL